MNDEIDKVLEERGASYGSFASVAAVSQEIKAVMMRYWFNNSRYESLPAPVQIVMEEGLQMMCSKLGRLACGDPLHADGWLDLAGYARLTFHHAINELHAWNLDDDGLDEDFDDVRMDCRRAEPEAGVGTIDGFDANFNPPADLNDPPMLKALDALGDIMKISAIDIEIDGHNLKTGGKATKQ